MVPEKATAVPSLISVRPGFYSAFTWELQNQLGHCASTQISTLFFLVMTEKLDQDRTYNKIKCLRWGI